MIGMKTCFDISPLYIKWFTAQSCSTSCFCFHHYTVGCIGSLFNYIQYEQIKKHFLVLKLQHNTTVNILFTMSVHSQSRSTILERQSFTAFNSTKHTCSSFLNEQIVSINEQSLSTIEQSLSTIEQPLSTIEISLSTIEQSLIINEQQPM